MLAPLGLSQVAVRELLAFQEHLNDPQEFVSNVDVRLFEFKLIIGTYLSQKSFQVLDLQLSKSPLLAELLLLKILRLNHDLVHRVENVHAGLWTILVFVLRH